MNEPADIGEAPFHATEEDAVLALMAFRDDAYDLLAKHKIAGVILGAGAFIEGCTEGEMITAVFTNAWGARLAFLSIAHPLVAEIKEAHRLALADQTTTATTPMTAG